MARSKLFRVGRVSAYLRGKVWYLRYHEDGKRRQVRAGADKSAVRQLAAQVNAQLETGAPSATGFEPISIGALRSSWLGYHERVLRSSISTINRYRTATQHLIEFLAGRTGMRRASDFRPLHAEQFVDYLRQLKTVLPSTA